VGRANARQEGRLARPEAPHHDPPVSDNTRTAHKPETPPPSRGPLERAIRASTAGLPARVARDGRRRCQAHEQARAPLQPKADLPTNVALTLQADPTNEPCSSRVEVQPLPPRDSTTEGMEAGEVEEKPGVAGQ
jgi:hypothetical protein